MRPSPLAALLVPFVTAAFAGGVTMGCASRAAAPGGGEGTGQAAAAPAIAPLAALAAEHVVLVPTQLLRDPGALGWRPPVTAARPYLDSLDAEIARALEARGVARAWVMPPDVVRSARRSPTVAADPYALAVTALEPGARAPSREAPLPEPLASQLRGLVALGDARYVLVPVALRLERLPPLASDAPAPPEAAPGRAVLRVALVDARASQVRWAGDVASDRAARLDPSLTATIATRLADLIAPR